MASVMDRDVKIEQTMEHVRNEAVLGMAIYCSYCIESPCSISEDCLRKNVTPCEAE